MALTLLNVIKHDTYVHKCMFQRFMVSFPDLRDVFEEGCKSLIGLDECHLKG